MSDSHRKAASWEGKMRRPIFVLVAVLIGSMHTAPARADTDVVAYLNSALAAKGVMVKRTRDAVGERTECHMTGLNGRPHRECNTWQEHYTQTFPDQARVTNAEVLSIQPIVWDEAKIKTLPATALIQRLTYGNCGEDAFTTGYTLSVKGSHSNSVSKTHSLSVKSGVQLKHSSKASTGIFEGQTEIQISLDVTTSDSTTNTEQFTTEETRTWPTTISVAPTHAGYLQLLAIQQSIEVPFSTTIVVDATMESNISGFSKVSQILNEPERTLPFEGVVKASQLSDSYAGNYKPDTPFNCSSPDSKDKIFGPTVTNLEVPLSSLGNTKDFSSLKGFFDSSQRRSPLSVSDTPEGITHQPIASSDILLGDARCGFDADGNPLAAIYSFKLDHYRSFERGTLMAQWDESVEEFKSCKSN